MNYSNYFIQELNYLYVKAIANNDTVLQLELENELNKRKVTIKLMKNRCYSLFNSSGIEVEKNCISKSEVYAVCRDRNYILI